MENKRVIFIEIRTSGTLENITYILWRQYGITVVTYAGMLLMYTLFKYYN